MILYLLDPQLTMETYLLHLGRIEPRNIYFSSHELGK
jgi:hypothetical protein